uniref:Zn(2)-C6 fungal-type domain-containing protein n=1 Tax=Bionectria ochroleuca TaxID=29856 RepID=A0A0B7JNW7_BIOOC
MNSSKWRISKACHECRARKVRCNGQTPCERCKTRGIDCVYREKARIRQKASQRNALNGAAVAKPPASAPARSTVPVSQNQDDGADDLESEASPGGGGESNYNVHSVAATHEASPSCLIQLYYGPSSNFSLLHSIYHQIEGTVPSTPSRQGVEEVGPGLDLFSHRRLFFGDLADTNPPLLRSDDFTGILLSPATAQTLLERYLDTYWHALPFMSKEEHRTKLDEMFRPPGVFGYDSPECIIILLGISLGAYMLGQHTVSEFLYQKSRQGSEKLEEVVNVQMVQVYTMMITILQIERARPNSSFLHLGSAVRRALAIGLHKEAIARGGETRQDMEQKRTTFWSLFFWETWICFMIGRPNSIVDPGTAVPMPKKQKFLKSMVTLSRIMAKCTNQIYTPRHDSLMPMWNAANEIREQLHRFAECQPRDMGFELVGHTKPGEEGFCQTLLSSTYHQTLLLTFRPFLILRGKLRRQGKSPGTLRSAEKRPAAPPPWFDKACQICLDTAKSTINNMANALHTNELCKGVKYQNYFVEGACYVLALDLLQEPYGSNRDLRCIRTGLRCLQALLPNIPGNNTQTPTTIAAIVRMVRCVVPDFEIANEAGPDIGLGLWGQNSPSIVPDPTTPMTNVTTAFAYPSMPLSSDFAPLGPNDAFPGGFSDFTAADLGLNFDFGTMDMDAFLSIDTNPAWDLK